MNQKRINDFAKENGYDFARYSHSENDKDYYIPDFKGDGFCCVGLPYSIIVSGENIWMSEPDETFQIFDAHLTRNPQEEN